MTRRARFTHLSSAITALVLSASLFGAAAPALAFSITPYKWGNPTLGTPGGVVTYSLMPTGTNCSALQAFIGRPCGQVTALQAFMPSGFSSAIHQAFQAWQSVAGIGFLRVPDIGIPVDNFPLPGSNPGMGNIRLGGISVDGPGGILAFAFFPSPFFVSLPGDIFFDTDDLWQLMDDGNNATGFNASRVAQHEIGHSIGLAHDDSTTAVMNSYYTEATSPGLLPDDITGAQFIYGTPVPEPSSLLLMASGLVGLAAMAVWKRTGGGQRKREVN